MLDPTFTPASRQLAARGCSLRSATPADAEFQRDLYVAGRWNELAVTGWPEPVVRAFLRDQFRLQTHHYDQHYADARRLVIECDAVPAGRLLLHDSPVDLRIVDIALMPQFQRRGLGTALLTWVQEQARADKRPKVSLHVEPHNPAKRLYHRLGFVYVETIGVYELMEWQAVS
jgi:ribosomal protein S18 acetylase RimI-like enzyme